MNNLKASRRRALLVSCLVTICIFVICSHRPFRVEGDVAYAAKAAQQFVSGDATRFNRLHLVDPLDLSRDIETWLFWWPPSVCAAFVLVLKLGFTLGQGARLLMFVAALSGSVGWTVVAARYFKSTITLCLAVIPSVLYILGQSMPLTFSSGDGFVFGTIPWVVLAALKIEESWRFRTNVSRWRFWTLSFVLGMLYWLKFSVMLAVAALYLFLVIAAGRHRPFGKFWRHSICVGLGAALAAIPVVTLRSINHQLGGGDFLESTLALGRPAPSLVSPVLRSLGTVILPVTSGAERLGNCEPSWLPVVLTLPVSGLLLFTLSRLHSPRFKEAGILVILFLVVPITGLGYLMLASGYDFLLDAPRHCMPYWVFLQVLFVGILSEELFDPGRAFKKNRLLLATVVYGSLLTLYQPYLFVRAYVQQTNSSSDNGLYVPTLGSTEPEMVIDAVRRALISDRSVVVPATYWLGMETWLVLPGRLLPLTNFWHPLAKTHGSQGARYFSGTQFLSTQSERVVLVAPNPYETSDFHESVERIKARFPQATRWSAVFTQPAMRGEIWIADLIH